MTLTADKTMYQLPIRKKTGKKKERKEHARAQQEKTYVKEDHQ